MPLFSGHFTLQSEVHFRLWLFVTQTQSWPHAQECAIQVCTIWEDCPVWKYRKYEKKVLFLGAQEILELFDSSGLGTILGGEGVRRRGTRIYLLWALKVVFESPKVLWVLMFLKILQKCPCFSLNHVIAFQLKRRQLLFGQSTPYHCSPKSEKT